MVVGPGAGLVAVDSAPTVMWAVTVVAVAAPVLQTRAPTGKVSGPFAALFESGPTIFCVSGVINKDWAATNRAA